MRNFAESLARQHRPAEAIQAFTHACEAADRLAKEFAPLAARIECEKAHALNSCGTAWLQYGVPAQAVTC